MAVIFEPPTRPARRRSRAAAAVAPRRQPAAGRVAPPERRRGEPDAGPAAAAVPEAASDCQTRTTSPARTTRARPRRPAPAPVRVPVRAPVRVPPKAAKAAARARLEGQVQTQLPQVRRRTMRPRQLAITLAVAALGALLLNAASMERDAQISAFGLRRTAALAVLQPLAAFSHVLGLDRPRAALDSLAGQDGSGSPGGGSRDSADGSPQTGGTLLPVSAVSAVSPVTAGAPVRRSPSADRVIAARVPTAAKPLRVWVGGDSVAGFFGFGLDDLAAAMGTVAAHSHYQISTGLSRPDYYDWPAHLEADMRAYDPEVVIFLVGANDDQPLEVGSQVDDFGSDGWKAEYARRVGAVMDQILAEHRMVVWVGQPVMRAADFDAQMQVENAIYQSEAAKRPGVVFFDSRPVLSDAGGGYHPYLPDGSGTMTLMRADDGIHLTPAGGRRLARAVLTTVLTELASRGETVTVSGVR